VGIVTVCDGCGNWHSEHGLFILCGFGALLGPSLQGMGNGPPHVQVTTNTHTQGKAARGPRAEGQL
jgi:hypothetical protein